MNDTTDLQVDATNAEQLKAWDGGEGDYWARMRTIRRQRRRLPPSPSRRCGDQSPATGSSTSAAAPARPPATPRGSPSTARPSASTSPRGCSTWRGRGRSTKASHNATFVQGDAQVHPFEPASFDVALSRTGSMFFGDPRRGARQHRRALSGRAAGWPSPCGSRCRENEWFTSFVGALAAGRDLPPPPPDSPNPFSMSDPDRVRRAPGRLRLRGRRVRRRAGADDLRRHGAEAHDFIIGQLGWLRRRPRRSLPQAALAALLQTMQEHETPDGVQFGSAMWLVSARRP